MDIFLIETKNCILPIMNPTMARKRANTQNAGAKAEAKLNKQQKKPQTNRGSLRPNLSEMVLTETLPTTKPTKITEVETNPREPRSQTRSNCKESKETVVPCKRSYRSSNTMAVSLSLAKLSLVDFFLFLHKLPYSCAKFRFFFRQKWLFLNTLHL